MNDATDFGGSLSLPTGPERRTGAVSLRVGACRVEPDLNRIAGPAGETLVEPKAMAVLVYLARRPGKVVGADELIDAIWLGRPMGDNPVYKCIVQLRRALGDDPRTPAYIATVPKKGYRLIAPVEKIAPEVRSSGPRPRTGKPGQGEATAAVPALANGPGRVYGTVLLVLLSALAAVVWIGRIGGVAHPTDPARATLAVLPFEDLTPDPEHEYLADGLSEAVLNRLSAFRELRVIARTSSFAFKRSGYGMPRIAGLLGVQFVLQGSLRREGDRLRVSTALVDREGFQVWSGTFEGAMGEGFDLQDDIAAAVAASLVPKLSPLPAARRQPDFEAYQRYVLGREMLIRRPPDFWRLSREHFDRAVEIDRGFADAYAERATASIFGAFSVADPREFFVQAQRDIDRALALNPEVAQAHAAQGFLLQMRDPPAFAASEAPLRRALALDPDLVNAWNWLSRALRAQGRHAEADEALRRAARIDPLSPTIGANLAGEEARRGRFDAAERRLLRLLEVPQPAVMIHLSLIWLYRDAGRLSDALEAAKRRVLMSAARDGPVEGLGELVRIYATLGAWERAEYWRARAGRESPDSDIARLDRAASGLAMAYPGYAEAAREFRASLDATGVELSGIAYYLRITYGALLALAGDYEHGIQTLEAAIDPSVASQEIQTDQEVNARHALAWAWLRTGDAHRAEALLALLDRDFRQRFSDGRLHRSGDFFEYARTKALLGETTRALELLERAERAGWRGYYDALRDPRWDAVREEARFQAIMARVKADIDAQRARVERLDAEDDFVARLDAAIASKPAARGRS